METTPQEGDTAQSSYDGQYNKDGKRHGKGRMVFKYGVYEGEWANDKMQGHGVLHLKTGNVYEGAFIDNKFDGLGTLRWKNGKVYEGQLRSGQMCGRGKLTSDEGVYEGEFYDGEFSGRGKMLFGTGEVYTGEWRGGQMWGEGTLMCPDGTEFTGPWFKGTKHGRFVRKNGKGDQYSERYHKDDLEVSVKVKSRQSRAGRAVSRFLHGRFGGAEKEYEDVTSPGLDDSVNSTGGTSLFERTEVTQEDVERELDRRAGKRAMKGGGEQGACAAAAAGDRRTSGGGGHNKPQQVSQQDAWGHKRAPTSPGTAGFDEFFQQ
eukprot:Hpha_TRINITY_DN16304_c2_g1::TRINITY_DN16304_c2_g1_i1::g.59219::m.59219